MSTDYKIVVQGQVALKPNPQVRAWTEPVWTGPVAASPRSDVSL